MVTPAVKRAAVAHAGQAHDVSERRARAIFGVDRSMVRYRSRRPNDDAIRERMRKLAHERRRFGFRRLGILLCREGIVMNRKKLLRLYREEGLAVRRRTGRKRALGTRAPMTVPDGPNQRWSLDFVSDAFTDSRRFRILCIIDDFSRECLRRELQRPPSRRMLERNPIHRFAPCADRTGDLAAGLQSRQAAFRTQWKNTGRNYRTIR